MIKLALSFGEVETLIKLLENKAKEIHAWRVATKSTIRDKEYDKVATLLKRISVPKEG